MTFNKKTIFLCGVTILTLQAATIILNNTKPVEAYDSTKSSSLELYSTSKNSHYLDTKHKSADGQFNVEIGTFCELPLYEDDIKVKNLLFTQSSIEKITKENIAELKDMCLNSPYKYDEVYIKIDEKHALKYNPFTDNFYYGEINNNKFNITKEY